MVCKATNLTQSPIFWGFYKIAEKLINLLNLVWVWLICLFCCCALVSAFAATLFAAFTATLFALFVAAFWCLLCISCFVFGLLAVDVLSVTLANLGDLANFSNVTN